MEYTGLSEHRALKKYTVFIHSAVKKSRIILFRFGFAKRSLINMLSSSFSLSLSRRNSSTNNCFICCQSAVAAAGESRSIRRWYLFQLAGKAWLLNTASKPGWMEDGCRECRGATISIWPAADSRRDRQTGRQAVASALQSFSNGVGCRTMVMPVTMDVYSNHLPLTAFMPSSHIGVCSMYVAVPPPPMHAQAPEAAQRTVLH